MPTFNQGIRTVAGQNLFGLLNSGKTSIHYTKIVYSSLDLSGKTDDEIAQMTDVQPQELVIPNPSVLFKPKTATTDPETEIRAYGDNQHLNKGFYINTYALYACGDDGKEILLGVTLDDHPSWLPAYDGVRPQALTYNWDISNKNGTDNVKFTDAHDEYATYGDYQTFSEAVGSQLNSAVDHASSYAGNANTLSGSVSTNSSNITNLNNSYASISRSVNANSSDISTINGKLSNVTDNTSFSTAISNVSNSASANSNNINTLSSNISSNTSVISNVSSYENTLFHGKDNLLSSIPNNDFLWIDIDDGFYCYKNSEADLNNMHPIPPGYYDNKMKNIQFDIFDSKIDTQNDNVILIVYPTSTYGILLDTTKSLIYLVSGKVYELNTTISLTPELSNYATKSDLSNAMKPQNKKIRTLFDMNSIPDGDYLISDPIIINGPKDYPSEKETGHIIEISSYTNTWGGKCQKIFDYSNGIIYIRYYGISDGEVLSSPWQKN